jgi:hypothetical protein
MKLTKSQIKQLIKEEMQAVLNEKTSPMNCAYAQLQQYMDEIKKTCPGVRAMLSQDIGPFEKSPSKLILTVEAADPANAMPR